MISDREIISTRVIDASRDLLWRAYSEPDHLAKWWGPEGFTNLFQEFDWRPGGDWRFVMIGPHGTQYPNYSRFVELMKPERIIFQHISAPEFEVTVTFTEQADKTMVSFRMLFKTTEECAKVKEIVVPANEQNFDRLEAELREMTKRA